MSSSTVGPTYYADFNGLEGLKKGVKAEDPKAIRGAAQQFESLFTDMMLKSMRQAKLGDGLGDSQQSDVYQDMYDQQLALKISQGKGIGLADMLVQQLTRNSASKKGIAATPGATTTGALAPGSAAPGAAARGAAAPAAAAAAAAPSGKAAAAAPVTSADRISFVKALQPYAEAAGSQLGVSPDTVIAQAALETGWGQHVPTSAAGNSSLNLFGIKAGASWNGAVVSARTTEYSRPSQGTAASASSLTQPFRAYSSVQQGVNDYVTLLQRSPNYQQALGTGDDVGAFGGALVRGGYATDPGYVQKLQAASASVKALRATNASAPHAPLKIFAGGPTTRAGEIA